MGENDFRSGNCVYLTDVKNPSNKVAGSIENVKFSVCHDKIKCAVNELTIEPVEITDEILVSNGFRKSYDFPDRYFFPRGKSTFFIKKDAENRSYYIGMEDSGNDRRVSIPLRYIHEIQNAAYYIRGEEIEFNKY